MLSLILLLVSSVPPHLDRSLPVATRLKSLIENMTLSEKVGQMVLIDGRDNLPYEFARQQPGAILQILGNDTLPAYALSLTTRLQIPLLFGIDAIHGHSFWPGATIFPTQLTQASSWDESLIEQIGLITAREMNNTGTFWAFSPVLCIARDPRWGRAGESYGEDPLLIGKFASRLIRGLQSGGVAACAKHFAGYSETQGGRDSSESDLSVRKLRSFFLPPFEQAVASNVSTFMASYQATDGNPSSINSFLLRETLKNDWGFEGLVVTDWDTVGDLVNRQNVFATSQEAAIAVVEAGIDMVMTTKTFTDDVIDAVNRGLLNVSLVDAAVSRILKVKFDLGLFDNMRYPDLNQVAAGTAEHRAVALKAAEESLILLKNSGVLPVSRRSARTIAVLGPNADDAQAQLGDWVLGTGQVGTGQQPRNCTVTVLDGISAGFPSATVLVEKGAGIEPGENGNLTAAIEAAKLADLIVVVVGDRLMYYGEGKSTATLGLMGTQLELLNALVELKKPFVIDLIGSKPLILPANVIDAAGAIIAQFSPGMLGGTAFAEALTGDINPSGKLSISIPVHVGQIPVYYNLIRGQHGDRYADLTELPRWAFGFGLSYSTFQYSNPSLNKQVFSIDEDIIVTFTLTNRGPYDGDEIVQIYISDLVASVTWPIQELKAFQRVSVPAYQAVTVTITLKSSDCTIVTPDGKRIVEPGDFELRIAQASDNLVLRLPFSIQ